MPIVDMPLEKLREYQGQNPRPDDLDVYWQDALAELKTVEPRVEMRPIAFAPNHVEVFDLYFTGVGGARIHALYVKPLKPAPKSPGIVEFHGYSGNAGDIAPKLGWAALGYSIMSMDCRGQGGKSEDVGAHGVLNTLNGHIVRGIEDKRTLLYRSIFLDCVELADILMAQPHIGADRVAARGGSQGGGLALACAALNPRINRCAPCFPFLSDYRRVWEMDISNAYRELREWFRRFDPLHEREAEVFQRLGYIDVQHLAPRIRGPVLMSVCLRDDVCPPSTVYAAYNKIRAPKQMLVYPDYGHEGLPQFEDRVFRFMLEM
jgi:cephalosporin-C deacetylase